MKKTFFIKFFSIFFSIFSTILLVGYFIITNNTKLNNSIAEFFFLKIHRNTVAETILNLNKNPDHYTYFLLGRILFVEGQLKMSVDNYTKSIEKKPKFKESYYGRGLAYGFSNAYFLEDAKNDFQKYLELDQEESLKSGNHAYGVWAGYNDLAWVHFLLGEFKEGEAVSREGLRISGANPWLLNMLGVSLISQHKCQEAKQYLALASTSAKGLTVEKFGEAYSGDNASSWGTGLKDMQNTISENISTCNK